MSAVKNQYYDISHPGMPAALPLLPRFVFILTMNGKPLGAYANEPMALRDLALMKKGDERDGYQSIYAVKLLRIDYTTAPQ